MLFLVLFIASYMYILSLGQNSYHWTICRRRIYWPTVCTVDWWIDWFFLLLHSGRTQHQARHSQEILRSQPDFERVSSKRFSSKVLDGKLKNLCHRPCILKTFFKKQFLFKFFVCNLCKSLSVVDILIYFWFFITNVVPFCLSKLRFLHLC